jgi:hypothetical protein
MLVGEVQIDGRLFEIAMSEQYLNRAEVSARFEQMRRKAVPQGVRMNVLMPETSA